MKKAAVMLAMLVACLVTGCGDHQEAQAQPTTPVEVTTEPAPLITTPEFHSASCSEIAATITAKWPIGRHILQWMRPDKVVQNFVTIDVKKAGEEHTLQGQFQPLGTGKPVIFYYRLAHGTVGSNANLQFDPTVYTSERPLAANCPGQAR